MLFLGVVSGFDQVCREGSVQALGIGWSGTLVKTWIWDPSFGINHETKTGDPRKGSAPLEAGRDKILINLTPPWF